jgi:hypothetical protein
LCYDYLFQEGPDHYVDAISSNGGTIFFIDQNDTGRAVSYSGPTNSYRAIHSTLIFGALQENTSTRNELMAQYIDYLTELTGIKNEIIEPPVISNPLKNHPNPFQIETKIYWSVKTSSSVEIKIYDRAGSLVKNLFNGQSEPGNHSIVWDGKNNSGKEVNPGTYFIQFNNGSVSTTKAIVKTR